MTGKTLTRKSKVVTLVPLAVVSALWTASVITVGSSAIAARPTAKDLPDGTSVPDKAIQAPASVPVPGFLAPAVKNGTSDQVVASASTNGIPSAALSAYQRGAQIMGAADTTCHIPWELIAAIGRVESNHGQYGGNTLTADGVSKPGIYGPELNGKNGTQAISDTDGGELDKDPTFDRAVGPMQFIPSTWSVVKVDADGDGQRNPQDIDDAGLATAVYLCSGNDDLATRSGQETAVYRYNHSHSYVNLVLRIMEAYSQGDYSAIPSGTYGGNLFSPNYTSAIDEQQTLNATTGPKPQTHPHLGSNGPSGGTTGTTGTPSTPGDGSGSGPDPGGTDNGGSTPSGPSLPTGGSDPVTQAVQGATGAVGQVTAPITQPVVDTLNAVEAKTLCSQQIAAVDPTGLIRAAATPLCANKAEGKTQADALAMIPNTLCGVAGWLGIKLLLVCKN